MYCDSCAEKEREESRNTVTYSDVEKPAIESPARGPKLTFD